MLRDEYPPEFSAGTALWDALSDAATALEGATGRRVVLVLTDSNDNSSVLDPDAVRARVDREGIMLYAIGIKGQSGLPSGELATLARAAGGRHRLAVTVKQRGLIVRARQNYNIVPAR